MTKYKYDPFPKNKTAQVGELCDWEMKCKNDKIIFMKDFDSWNKEKKVLEHVGRDTLPFHEREIWWCSMGINLGDEQDGKNELFERPVLILKKFNNKVAWVLPMSSKIKDGMYYHNLEHDGKTFTVILSQLRLTSVKRLRRYIRRISPHQFSLIQDKLIQFINKP